MLTFMVERNVSGQVGDSAETLIRHAQRLTAPDSSVVWRHTYTSRSKLYIICQAVSKEALRRQALRCDFIIHRISEIVPTKLP